MKRDLYESLVNWKNAPNRKPLILQGARQVGKTWLMREFGKNEFEQVVYLNFEGSERLKSLFVPDFDIKRILSIIEIEVNHKIQRDKTLLIFDETYPDKPIGEREPKIHVRTNQKRCTGKRI